MSLVEAITDVIHDGLFPAWTDSTSWLIDSVSYGGDNSTGGLVASSSATVVSMMASGSLRLLCDSCSFDPHVTRISFWAKGAAVLPSSPAPLTLEVSASEILTLGNIEALSPVLLNVGSLAATDGSAEDAQEWVDFSAFLGSGGNVAVLPPEGALFDTIAFNNFNQEPLAFELDLLRVIVPVSESQGRGGERTRRERNALFDRAFSCLCIRCLYCHHRRPRHCKPFQSSHRAAPRHCTLI